MKYCPACKLRANDNDNACSRCGKLLRTIGTAPAQSESDQPPSLERSATDTNPETSGPQPAPVTESEDQLLLQGLEQDLAKSRARLRWMGAMAGLMALLLIGVLFWIRQSYVMQFAEIDDLHIAPSEPNPGTVVINYQPRSEGQIQFVRQSSGRLETLVDHASGTDTHEFQWAGEDGTGYTVQIRFRDGWRLVDREWNSPVRNEPSDETLL